MEWITPKLKILNREQLEGFIAVNARSGGICGICLDHCPPYWLD